MIEPDYASALAYAHNRLATELPANLRYHNFEHTFEEVLPASMHLAQRLEIPTSDKKLLEIAAAFHDLGWIVQGKGHEAISSEVCLQILPNFGFNGEQIAKITRMILATQVPQRPASILEKILVDADMFILGTESFWQRNADLRYEIELKNGPIADRTWYRMQLEFLQNHHYFTQVAQNEQARQKELNLRELKRLIASLNGRQPPAPDQNNDIG